MKVVFMKGPTCAINKNGPRQPLFLLLAAPLDQAQKSGIAEM